MKVKFTKYSIKNEKDRRKLVRWVQQTADNILKVFWPLKPKKVDRTHAANINLTNENFRSEKEKESGNVSGKEATK